MHNILFPPFDRDAEDALQIGLLKASRNLNMWDYRQGEFDSWFYTVLRNAAVSYCRNNGRRFALGFYNIDEDRRGIGFVQTVDVIDPSVLPYELIERNETAAVVRLSLDVLNQRERESIVLFYFEELRVIDIAKILDCPIGTVKASLHRGRKKLKKKLNVTL